MPFLSSTAGRSSWCVSLEIYLGAWQMDLELWMFCSWGGVTPWTKPCWFTSLWAQFWAQEFQRSQPASALLRYFWFWGSRSLILKSDLLLHFSESNKTFLHCSSERENAKWALSICTFYIKNLYDLNHSQESQILLTPSLTQPGKNKAGDQLNKDFFLFLVPELRWQKPYFKPWKLFPVEASGSLALAASKLKLFS